MTLLAKREIRDAGALKGHQAPLWKYSFLLLATTREITSKGWKRATPSSSIDHFISCDMSITANNCFIYSTLTTIGHRQRGLLGSPACCLSQDLLPLSTNIPASALLTLTSPEPHINSCSWAFPFPPATILLPLAKHLVPGLSIVPGPAAG